MPSASSPKKDTQIERRKAVRYSTKNHKASITLKQFLTPAKHINIDIINISSTGARISTKYKFSTRSSVILNLKVRGRQTWKIPAKLLVTLFSDTEHGLAFNTRQFELMQQIINNKTDFTIE